MTTEQVERRKRLAGSVVGLVWIALWMWPLLEPVSAVAHGQVTRTTLVGVALTVFIVLYLAVAWAAYGQVGPLWLRLVGLGVVAVVGTVLAAVYTVQPGGWLILMLYVGVCCAAALPWRVAPAGIAGAAVAALVIALARGVPVSDYGQVLFSTVMAGALVMVVGRMSALIDELRATRGALAEAAVAEERLRFARDLHDLLGHTLSLIVVKAEVVRRLGRADPEVVAQAADIEEIGRQALVEVREAVTGYREGGLATELDRARDALADAGIEATVRADAAALPVQVDALLAWAVREGVTNVIRHSGARHCRIDVRRVDGLASAEVCDDGAGPAAEPVTGNGLRGLAERMAAVGGALSTGDAPGGGYRLAVDLPLDPELAEPTPVAP
jgi:two-component system sensor histidine kinase DesK